MGTDGRIRKAASQINRYPRRKRGLTPLSADGAVCPIIYGREETEGYKFAEKQAGSFLYIGMVWCVGPINKVESVYINDVDVNDISGVSYRHYLGSDDQTADSWLAGVIDGYEDNLVFVLPGGSVPAAYSVFKISSGAIDGAPRIRAVIQGKIINDPDAGSNTDPYFNDVGVSISFADAPADTSANEHDVFLSGDATIDSGGLQLPVQGSPTLGPAYAYFIGDSTFDFLGSEFCEEWVITSTNAGSSPEVTETIFSGTDTASPQKKIAKMELSGSNILFYLSTDGSTWDMVNGETIATITTSQTKITIERIGNQLTAYKDGTETWTKEVLAGSPLTAQSVYQDTSSPAIRWYIGTDLGTYFIGSIQAWRRTIGTYRYGSDHVATASPFADSDTYAAGDVYSTKPALYWADFATNTVYGLGATVEGVSAASAWGDETLQTGETRATSVGMTLSAPRRAEDWLDLMATYAHCIWYPEGGVLRIQPDRDVSSSEPSGLENIVQDPDFDGISPSPWTLGLGWGIASGIAIRFLQSPDDESEVTQTLTTEAGETYAISFDLLANSPKAGSISVYFDGYLVIPPQTEAGTYTAFGKASGTSTELKFYAPMGTRLLGLDNIRVRRKYYLEQKQLKDSIRLSGASERDTPTSCKVSFTSVTTDSEPWSDDSVVITTPNATSGDSFFIQTSLSLPGLRSEDQAKNHSVLKLQRLYKHVTSNYVAADHAILHRPGDVIQLKNTNRGIDKKVSVEDIEMIDYGRWRVKGYRYGVSVPDPRFLTPAVEYPYQFSDSVDLDIDPQRVLLAVIENATQGKYEFTSIPQGYNRLIIEGFLRMSDDGSSSLEGDRIFLNGDTTDANYHYQILRVANGVSPQTNEASKPLIFKTSLNSAPSGSYSSVRVVIEEYTGSQIKIASGYSSAVLDSDSLQISHTTVRSSITDAVTSITIEHDEDPVQALLGTLRLYGEY